MRAPLFFQAVAIGFAIAAPVGPIGLLCIQRTLIKGYAVGLLTGLGAATADAMYGTVGAFGLSAATQWLVDSQVILRLFGGLFLILLGLKGIFLRSSRSHSFEKSPSPESNYEGSNITKPAVPELRQWVSQQNLLGAYLSTFVLTLSNPLTILSFVALFASVGLEEPSQNVLTASVFVGGGIFGLGNLVVLSVRLCGGVSGQAITSIATRGRCLFWNCDRQLRTLGYCFWN